jgi:hypothetical protein
MRAFRAFFMRAGFERELKRKSDRHRFHCRRELEAFKDYLTKIGEGDQAGQAQMV